MNRTLLSLSLSGSMLPFIVNPIKYSEINNKFKNIHSTKSFSPFLMDNSLRGFLKVENSKFHQYLSNVIRIDSETDIVSSVENTHKHIYGHKMDVVIIESSFTHCTSTSSNGGAIFFDRKTLAARIDRCIFQKCLTKKSGGAFHACIGNISVFRTCFQDCQAAEHSHAILINLNEQKFTGNISEITMTECATRERLVGRAAINLLVGTFATQFNNISDCHALQFSATYACLSSTIFNSTFSEFTNCSSYHLFRFFNINQSVLMMFNNFINNIAVTSLFGTSARNNFINCVFINNKAPDLVSGKVATLQLANCVLDQNYTFKGQDYVRTPYQIITENPKKNDIKFAFSGGVCRILGDVDGLNVMKRANQIADSVSQSNRKYVDLFRDRMAFQPAVPTPRDVSRVPRPDPFESEAAGERGSDIITPRPITPRVHTPADSGRRTPTRRPPRVPFTPSAPFTASETFFHSRTFLPSLQFTASAVPRQSLVPYVLYSAAGFVVFAVLTSFLFLKSADAGYLPVNFSESADSRVSDYASSTSTTVTITGESSSVVV